MSKGIGDRTPRAKNSIGPAKLSKSVEEDLIAENQRMQAVFIL